MKVFQTDFEFIKNDIEKFRAQDMKQDCFDYMHPWAYDLKYVDFKYIMNNDLTSEICKALDDCQEAQIFWLTFFKC